MIRKRNNKRTLYESIMRDVAKTVKRHLNESTVDPQLVSVLERELSEQFNKLIGKQINLDLDPEFLKKRLETEEYKNNLHAALGILVENYVMELIDKNNISMNIYNEDLIREVDEQLIGNYINWDFEDQNSIFRAEIKTFFNDDLNCYLSYQQYNNIGSDGFFILVNVSIDINDNNVNIFIKDIYVKQRKNLQIDNRYKRIVGFK